MKELTTINHWDNYAAKLDCIIADKNYLQVKVLEKFAGKKLEKKSVLEIGFAPGTVLAFLRKKYLCEVTGVDYSPVGVEKAKKLFSALCLTGDLRYEDIFKSTLPDDSFDFVCSFGVIEHFDDPLPILKKHVELCKKGGRIMISIPNHRVFYERFPFLYDKNNYLTHNSNIMHCDKLLDLSKEFNYKSFSMPFGGFSLAGCGRLNKNVPRFIRSILCRSQLLFNIIPDFNTASFSPHLLLVIDKDM